MPKCSVKKCKNNTITVLKRDGVSYFRFPCNEIHREKWRIIISQERGEQYFKPNNSSVVCSEHFVEADMYYSKKGFRRIKKGAFPKIGVQKYTDINTADNVKTKKPLRTTLKELISNETQSDCISDLTIIIVEPENAVIKQEPSSLNVSPSSSDISVLDTPGIVYYKKRIANLEMKLELRTKEVRNLKKRNNRLMERNSYLELLVEKLKKKRKQRLILEGAELRVSDLGTI